MTLGAVALALASSIATVGAQTPPSVTVRHTSTFTGVNAPLRHFNLIQGISEFLPGQAARNNSTPGPRFFTVVEGTVTVLIGDKTEVFGTGKNWTVPGGITFGIKNEAEGRARVFFSVLSQPGAQPSPQPGSAVPASPSRILQTVTTPVTVKADVINVVQVVQDWAPGARNPNHHMNHPHVYSMLEGESTTRYLDGASEAWKAGDAAVMEVNRDGYMQNSGAAMNTLYFTWLVLPGTPLTSPAAAPAPAPAMQGPPAFAPPRTGDGGLLGTVAAQPGQAESWLGIAVIISTVVCSKTVISRARRR
jgi:quercetin dioxygenase-like cupin family protein